MWFRIVNLEAKTESRVSFHLTMDWLNWEAAERFGRLLLGDQFLCVEVDSDEYPESEPVACPASSVRVRRIRKPATTSKMLLAGAFR